MQFCELIGGGEGVSVGEVNTAISTEVLEPFLAQGFTVEESKIVEDKKLMTEMFGLSIYLKC